PLAALESHPPATSNLQIPAVGLRHARAAGLWKLCRSCEDRLGASFGRRRHHRTDDVRITRVSPCVARGLTARSSFMFAGWLAPASLEAAMSANCSLVYQSPGPDNRFPRTFSAAYHRYM